MVSLKATGNSSWNKEQLETIRLVALGSEKGMAEVREKDHSSGLEVYNLAGAEYLRQYEIQQDYNRRNASGDGPFETDEFYFLVDYGFNVLYPEGEIPAFFTGRQANFGRTANNLPLSDEIYTDKGAFQETYTGSRIDFGGSRTKSEAEETYHDRLKRVTPAMVDTFLAQEIKRIGSVPAGSSRSSPSADRLPSVFSGRYWDKVESPHGPAIGRSHFDVKDDWHIDSPEIARMKAMLFQMNPAQLKSALDALDNDALENLYLLSSRVFQMPLPEFVYRYGFERAAFRKDTVIRAAAMVFERFPALLAPALRFELEELAASGNSWPPSSIETLIYIQHEFPGYEDFLMEVMKSRNSSAKTLVLHQISRHPAKRARIERILKYVAEQESDAAVLKEADFRFGQNMKRACDTDLNSRF